MKKRIVSAVLALVLCLSLLPAAALAADPQSRSSIQLGASAINGWSAANGYDYIYLGNWTQGSVKTPVKWRVLSANGDGASYYYDFNTARKTGSSALFLLSEDVLDSVQFNTSNRNKWTSSAALNWCTDFAKNSFASVESRSILETYQKKDTAGTFNGTAYTNSNQVSNGSKVFFLYAGEATKAAYGLGSADTRKANSDWWLITAAKNRVKSKYLVGSISKDTGEVTPTIATEKKGTRPALNLNKDQVLFTAAADNSAHTRGLTACTAYSGHEFKLTLKDANTFADGAQIIGGRTTWNNAYTNASFTVQHKALKNISGDYTNVTAALTDSDGKLLYYGSVNQDPVATSTTVTLPNGLSNGTYTLCLYGEDWNGACESDFATGTPYEVTITIHDGANGPDLTPRKQDGLMSIGELAGYDAQWGYNYLYFGKFGSDPILWRVLSTSGNATGENDTLKQGDDTVSNSDAMFLLSEYLLGQDANGGLQFTEDDKETNVQYKGSNAQAWCRASTSSQSNAFTSIELSAMLDTTKSDAKYAGKNWRNKVYAAVEDILENDKVFFLSAEEAANAAYGFATEDQLIAYSNGAASEWWLRSSLTDAGAKSVGAVTHSNTYGWELCPKVASGYAPARPAFNLSKNDVLFVCTADGVKTGAASSALTEIAPNTTSKWKLTLRDESRSFAVTETAVSKFANGQLTLHYTGAVTGENEFISAIVYNADGKAAYYGQLKALSNSADAEGTVSLTVPALDEGDYTLRLFNEHCSGANQTDCASDFCTVTLTVDNTAPVLSDFSVSRASDSTASVTFTANERGSYYYTVTDSETAPAIGTDAAGTAMTAGTQTLELEQVPSGKSYLHILAKDEAGNVCTVQTIKILGYLPAPEGADWDSAVLGRAAWNAVGNASGYSVQLYKNGAALGSPVTVTSPEYTFVISEPPAENDGNTSPVPTPGQLPDNAITGPGSYSFRVIALGDGADYSNSTASESARRLSSITIEANENGRITASARYAVTGTEITLTGEPNTGYHFDAWQIAPDVTVTDNKFIMPDQAVTIRADFTWYFSGILVSYPVTVKDSENGNLLCSHKRARAGATVTLTAIPGKGSTLQTLLVLDQDGNALKLTERLGRYTFTMPSCAVTVTAVFTKGTAAPTAYTDMKTADYFYDAVLWAAQMGITSGTDAAHFSPNAPCTRAQIVTFLWRAAGSPVVSRAMNMTDVDENAYYAEAVRWALQEGITTGTSDTTFSPDAVCTRAQAVAFLFRCAAPDAVTLQELVSGFADAASVPGYALNAMNWALSAGIVQGSGGKLMPNDICSRAQIVTFLYRTFAR